MAYDVYKWHFMWEWDWLAWHWLPTRNDFATAECIDWGPFHWSRRSRKYPLEYLEDD